MSTLRVQPARWLLGDIGGTNTRLTVWNGAGTEISATTIYRNSEFTAFDDVVAAFLREQPQAETVALGAAFAVAGPVTVDCASLTNRGWHIAATELREKFSFAQVKVINDFAAVAWSLPVLKDADLVRLGMGTARSRRPRAVLGPGTGLGVSALLPCEKGRWTALDGEGGHVTLAARNERESAVLAWFRQRYDHVSAERLVSGPGLAEIAICLCALDGIPEPTWRPEEVTAQAPENPHAAEALNLFFGFLGGVAGNLALTLGAQGGVYLAGGLLPRLESALQASDFRLRFLDKGRFRTYLAEIPTFLIKHSQPGLLGLTEYLRQHCGPESDPAAG